MSAFVRVGKVKDAHGIRGELFVILFAGEADWLDELKTIRLIKDESGNERKELTIKSARMHKNGLIVKTSELSDRNQAELLKGWLFEIPEEYLVSEPGEALFLREILGFEITVGEKMNVGTITGFSSNVAQDLLVVTTPQGEFEIPFVEDFVTGIDFEKKQVHLDLPPGLLGEELEE